MLWRGFTRVFNKYHNIKVDTKKEKLEDFKTAITSTVKSLVQEMIERKQSEVNKITKADDQRAFNDYL